MKQLFYILLITVSASLLSCSSDGGSSYDQGREAMLEIADLPDVWTYISLEQGRVVGTCALGDTTEERRWAQRTDWDVATCNGMLRTNSGTSGQAHGGIVSATPYGPNGQAPDEDYHTDTDTIAVW